MPSLWCYPWTLAREGLPEAWDRLHELGINEINLSGHYHSVRSMQPRFPDELFVKHPGGCHFHPKERRFEGSPINPVQVDIGSFDDPLAEIVESAAAREIAVNGWTVLCHNSRLGQVNPNYRIESAFGQPQDHAFCPSHRAVRNYFATVVEAIADRGVSEIQLESLGYGTVFHGHGSNFGHDKRQILTSRTEELLLSQCFCNGCREEAESDSVDINAAERVVRELLEMSFSNPHDTPPQLDALVAEHSVLHDLFEFRAQMIGRLLERLSDAAGKTPLNYYIMEGGSLDAGKLWPAGVRLSELEPHLDRVTALCYVRDPSVARERIHRIRTTFGGPIDVGITLDQETLRYREEFERLTTAAQEASDGRIHVYHHALATEEQLEWIRTVT